MVVLEPVSNTGVVEVMFLVAGQSHDKVLVFVYLQTDAALHVRPVVEAFPLLTLHGFQHLMKTALVFLVTTVFAEANQAEAGDHHADNYRDDEDYDCGKCTQYQSYVVNRID